MLAAKGDFLGHEKLGDLPDLVEDPRVEVSPKLSLAELLEIQVRRCTPQLRNTVSLASTQQLNLDVLLAGDARQLATVFELTTHEDLQAIVKTLHHQGQLGPFRRLVNKCLTALIVQVEKAVTAV